jgi:hypothetical protein
MINREKQFEIERDITKQKRINQEKRGKQLVKEGIDYIIRLQIDEEDQK